MVSSMRIPPNKGMVKKIFGPSTFFHLLLLDIFPRKAHKIISDFGRKHGNKHSEGIEPDKPHRQANRRRAEAKQIAQDIKNPRTGSTFVCETFNCVRQRKVFVTAYIVPNRRPRRILPSTCSKHKAEININTASKTPLQP